MTRAVVQDSAHRRNSTAAAIVSTARAQLAFDDSRSRRSCFPLSMASQARKRAAFGYWRIARAAGRDPFAIEQLPSDALAGAYLEVQPDRAATGMGVQQS